MNSPSPVARSVHVASRPWCPPRIARGYAFPATRPTVPPPPEVPAKYRPWSRFHRKRVNATGPLRVLGGVLTDSTVEPAPRDAELGSIEVLFRQQYRSLLGAARLLVDDAGIAEEVVQDAFVALHRRWSSLRDPAAAVGYLRSSVLN